PDGDLLPRALAKRPAPHRGAAPRPARDLSPSRKDPRARERLAQRLRAGPRRRPGSAPGHRLERIRASASMGRIPAVGRRNVAGVRSRSLSVAPDAYFPTSFPGSAWERNVFEALPRGQVLRLALCLGRRSLQGSAFPGRAWEREPGDAYF